MIYTTGTIAINGNTVKGTGTNFSAPLSLIRVGCTLIAISNPIQIFTITEIKSGTELSVTPAANPAIAAGTKFSILLSDSISVDGLAQDVAETLRFYQEKEDEISSAIDGSNIGLGPEPRDCVDISGNPSSYVGFLRIKETAKGFPSVAAGESFLSGFICQRDTTPSYAGVFVGWATRSLYTYTWVATSGPNWTRHARKNEVDRLIQRTGETRVCSQNANKFLTVYDSGSWGCFNSEASKYIPLSIYAGGTGATSLDDARTNLGLGRGNSPQLNSLFLDKYSDSTDVGTSSGILRTRLLSTNDDLRLAAYMYAQTLSEGKSQLTIRFVYNGLTGDSKYLNLNSEGDLIVDSAILKSTVEKPLQINSANPAIRFNETDRPANTPTYTLIANGGNWFIHKSDYDDAGSTSTAISYNFANDRLDVQNLKASGLITANSGIETLTGRDWNTQHTDNINKFVPIAGGTNGPAGSMVLGGFHVQYNTNYAVQFGGRNSGFWGRTIENGTVQEWRQLATLNNNLVQKWTGYQEFKSTDFYSDTFSRKLSFKVTTSTVRNGAFELWGDSNRPTVLEYKIRNPETDTALKYAFYAQQNTDDSIVFNVNGAVTCVTVTQSSDRDLKDNIQVIGDATEAIRKMNGYTYTLKENGLPYAGVIAQEVMEALPEAVGSFTHYGEALQGPTTDGNELREETRYLNVDYAAVTGLLVQVARETDNRVTELEEENASLRANIAVMDERIAKLEALVSKLTGSEK